MEDMNSKLRTYIRENFMTNPADKLDNTTPLLSSGIIDSISALELVEFLEQNFKLEFKPHEVDQDNLNTIELMEAFIHKKKAQ